MDIFEYGFMQRALLAALLTGLAAPAIGTYLVQRRMAVMGEGIGPVAVTGVAGPGGGTPEKPVGTVCLGAFVNGRIETRRVVLPGEREEIRERAAQAALALLWRILKEAG